MNEKINCGTCLMLNRVMKCDIFTFTFEYSISSISYLNATVRPTVPEKPSTFDFICIFFKANSHCTDLHHFLDVPLSDKQRFKMFSENKWRLLPTDVDGVAYTDLTTPEKCFR